MKEEIFKDDFVEWLAFTWHMYACNSKSGVKLEYSANKEYRVTRGIETLYQGHGLVSAVNIYNKHA